MQRLPYNFPYVTSCNNNKHFLEISRRLAQKITSNPVIVHPLTESIVLTPAEENELIMIIESLKNRKSPGRNKKKKIHY